LEITSVKIAMDLEYLITAINAINAKEKEAWIPLRTLNYPS